MLGEETKLKKSNSQISMIATRINPKLIMAAIHSTCVHVYMCIIKISALRSQRVASLRPGLHNRTLAHKQKTGSKTPRAENALYSF